MKPKFVHIASETLVRFNPELEGWLLGGFAHSLVFDNSKIKSLVPDFVATTTFQRGIEQTIAHFRSDAALQFVDATFDQWCDRTIGEVEKLRASV